MFYIAFEQTPPKFPYVPHIPMLVERNVRKGFFEHKQYLAVLEAAPAYIKPVIMLAYTTGMRKEEILSLTWDQVDLDEGTIRLEPGDPKNEQSRTIYLEEDLLELLEVLYRRKKKGCSFVFQHMGKRIRDFRGAWEQACKKAGLWGWDKKKGREAPTRIFHDFRRTAIRNMIRAGITEKVAMTISGHRSRSVFDRYNIVSPEDLKIAARMRQTYRKDQASRLQKRLQSAPEKKKAVAHGGPQPVDF